MRLNVIADVDWESKIDRVVNELSDFGFRRHFEALDYGRGLGGVTIVFMCQDPTLSLKQRIRHAKKEAKIYMDIMLDLPAMKEASPEARKQEVAERLFNEVPKILGKFKIPDFKMEMFIADLRAWVDSTGWRPA